MSRTNRRAPWQMHQDDTLDEQLERLKMAGSKRVRDPHEKFYVFVTDEYGNSENAVEDCASLTEALERIAELDEEFTENGSEPEFTLVRGVEIKVKKAGYEVDTEASD